MNLPKTTVDEYGRIICKAHNLETCPICCLSFESINEEINATPSDRDIGVFIPERDLLDWYEKMKKKMPKAFAPGDTLFGDDAGQHSYGTKLRTFFDEDPQHPMECYVLGSKWQVEEGLYPGMPSMFADGREPMYAVLLNGENAQIHLTSAHEGDQGDWMIDTKKARKENGIIINERLDMLARLNGNHKINVEDDDNEIDDGNDSNSATLTLKVQNSRIQRAIKALKVLNESEADSAERWDRKEYGKFVEEFMLYCFTPYERNMILQLPRGGLKMDKSDNVTLEECVRLFPSSTNLKDQDQDCNNFKARIALAKMAIYHVKENLGGVVLANKRGTKFQAIEFINPCKSHGVPCISIQYGVDPEGIDRPKDFLAGETVEVMEEENSVAVTLEEHLLDCTKNESLNDLGSGLLFYQGYLSPMMLLPLCEHSESDSAACPATIPRVNFGVELEMSCASGNRMDKMASNLAKHTGVEVKTRENQGKGKGGFWPYGISKGKSYDSDSDGDISGNSSCSSHASMPDLDPVPQLPTHTASHNIKSHVLSGSKDSKKASNHTKWSFCYDKSLKPNEDNPMSTMLELVSPILTGEDGLTDLEHTLKVMSDIVCVRLNKSMGLHVHVETKESDFSLSSMISICQQFVIYEEIIDGFLNMSRRSGSEQSYSYFQSNRLSIMNTCNTFKGALDRLALCQSRKELYSVMNPGERARYHKLNMQNLKTGRQQTIEFRQHHASKDPTEVRAWVRFCILFTTNSAKLHPISSSATDPISKTFDTLFTDIIQCPVLREYYSMKK